jgi:predicted alpha/beta-fold hydrolase
MQAPAPWWLPGGHLQTVVSAKLSRRYAKTAPRWQRERWVTPDDDFIDVDWVATDNNAANDAPNDTANAPLLVLFHGLEGSSQSHYAQAFAHVAARKGWRMALPHFRGCSGELNRAPRAYHSGDWREIDWVLAQCQARHPGPLYAAGVSLGGNALMRWAGELGAAAAARARAVASICSPLDLVSSGVALGRGLNRVLYTPMFLHTMKPKARRKWQQHPGLFDLTATQRAKTLWDFDDAFTAPVHGFRDVMDYWTRASAKPVLRHITIPALALNARNDPFVPVESLPTVADISPSVTLWQPAHGGHVGFAQGRWPGQVWGMPEQVCAWLEQAGAGHG